MGGGCKACEGLFWTGTYCLARGPAQCVPGTSGGCKGPAVSFTGTKCCVPPDMTCVAGTIDGCKGPRKTWTGSMCCTEGMNNQCFASASSDCSGPGAIFTGCSAMCPLSGFAVRAPERSATRRAARGPATSAAARLRAECADMYRLSALVWIEVSAPRCACAHDRFCLILFTSLTSQP